MTGRCAVCVAGVVGLAMSAGSVAGAEKGRYSLFNPTPDRLLREMTTDRPDATESPFTVDAGRVQVETNLLGFARSHADDNAAVTDTLDLVTTNIRIGLTSRAEINFVWQPYGTTRTRQLGLATERASGIGSLDIRGKINLWGNDDFERQGSALALLPYITLPTDARNGISSEHMEGGIIVPLAVALPNNFGIGFNGGIAWLRSETTGDYNAEYLATAALSYEWTGKLGTYYEIAANFAPADDDGTAVMLGTGLTYAVSDNVQLDAGINFGVTSAADRFNPFVGISTRF